ncbi:MAG: cupin domain-containing protein [Chloroflexi bacterium]|nr:cupin domain-containing protein [Chloroflexota bacterium]
MILKAKEQKVTQVEPGVRRSVLQSGEKLMLVRIELSAGKAVAAHQHPHEQITHLLEGRVRFTVGDETVLLEPGDSCLLPANVPHGATALEESVLIDAFSPPREDFLA